MKKRTEILIEVERVRIIYQKNQQLIRFCDKCTVETEFVTEDEAFSIIGIRPTDDLHTQFALDNNLIFCLKSIIEKII